MNHLAKIIFFGNERLATGVTTTAPTLQALISAGYNVVAVVSHFEQANSRKSRGLEIASVAKEHNIPLLLPNKPAEITDQLKAYGAEVGVLVAYGKIVPQTIIDIFPKGIINIHPSALPKHRGPTPIESIILSGETSTAVSVMQLVSAMDAGPVYVQEQVQLTGQESKHELSDKLLAIGGKLVLDVLPKVLTGSIEPTPQDDTQATFDKLLQKQDGLIDWTKPAQQIEREIRAYAQWPKSYTRFKDLDVVITQARVVEQNEKAGKVVVRDKELIVYCGKDALVIDKLKPAGKPQMDASEFINGYKKYL